MPGPKLYPNSWGENGTGFYRFSVLGSAEGERWQAGPRFSPPTTSSRFNAFTGYGGRCLRGAARPGLKPRVYSLCFLGPFCGTAEAVPSYLSQMETAHQDQAKRKAR